MEPVGNTSTKSHDCRKWNQKVARLFLAAKNGQTRVLRQALEDNSEVLRAIDPIGHSIAHWATRGGQVKVLRFLHAEMPEALTVINTNGQLPVHIGCVMGKFLCVAFLINHYPILEEPDMNGQTPLSLAVENGHVDLVAYLLMQSANINAVDDEGNNVLHFAVKTGNLNLCSLVLRYASHLCTKPNNAGQTPLQMACALGNLDLVRLLFHCIPSKKNIATLVDKNSLVGFRGNSELGDFLKMQLVKEENGKNKIQNLVRIATDLKRLIFGEPGRRRFGLLYINFSIWLLLYPYFWIQVLHRQTNVALSDLRFAWILLNIPSWISYHKCRVKDPGYLPTNTTDYHSVMRTARETNSREDPALLIGESEELWDESMAKFPEDLSQTKRLLKSVCHTCRCVKPIRAKHCPVCDRCIATFDHHCPMTDRCVGKGNRVWFFTLCGLTSWLSTLMIYLLWIQEVNELSPIPTYVLRLVLFSVWSSSTITFCSVLHNAMRNLTTNETINWQRYTYLHGNSRLHFQNPFDRGWITNLLEYFGLRQQLDLDVIDI